MNFTEHKLPNIKNPFLVPPGFEILNITQDGWVEYLDKNTNQKAVDEPVFVYGQETIFLEQHWKLFENQSAACLLFSPNSKLYIHQRSDNKRWEPGKLDLFSVVGQNRAIFKSDKFELETPQDNIIREMVEEIGIAESKIDKNKLEFIGTHHNPLTKEHQTVFAYQANLTLDELNQNIKNGLTDQEVKKWFEHDYNQVLDEYFSDQIDKYAGGRELRPLNFISNPEIKNKLDEFYNQLTNS